MIVGFMVAKLQSACTMSTPPLTPPSLSKKKIKAQAKNGLMGTFKKNYLTDMETIYMPLTTVEIKHHDFLRSLFMTLILLSYDWLLFSCFMAYLVSSEYVTYRYSRFTTSWNTPFLICFILLPCSCLN